MFISEAIDLTLGQFQSAFDQFQGLSIVKTSENTFFHDVALTSTPSIDALAQAYPKASVLTLVASELSYSQLSSALTKLASDTTIVAVRTLSVQPAAVELIFESSETISQEQWSEWLEFTAPMSIDIGLKAITNQGHRCRLACFDMDSTLIKAEVIDELAAEAGKMDKVSEITERAMRGELDFQASFRERLGMLKGLEESAVKAVMDRIELMDGAEALFKFLNDQGIYTVILSGGFNVFAEEVKKKLNIRETHSNQLNFEQGGLTGLAVDPIMDADRKEETLQKIAEQLHIPLSQTLAVGDGANDLPMLGRAGLGVAFRAKPKVQASARIAIRFGTLADVKFFLGFTA